MKLDAPMTRDVVDRPREFLGVLEHLSVEELRMAQLGPDDYAPSVRGLVIGESPGKRNPSGIALFPWSENSAAGRLMSMGGLSLGEYLGGAYRRNLCDTPGDFDDVDAAQTAREILTGLFDQPSDLRVVLLGQKVASAFERAGVAIPSDVFRSKRLETRQRCVVLPHPSGLNRLYNDQSVRFRARCWIRWAFLGEEKPKNATL